MIRGKLDQKNQELEVDYAIGRDTRPEVVSDIVNVLQEWWVYSSNDMKLVMTKWDGQRGNLRFLTIGDENGAIFQEVLLHVYFYLLPSVVIVGKCIELAFLCCIEQ